MTVIGIDTNVILRALLDDDAVQSPAARDLLAGLAEGPRGYVGVPVVLELYWVLNTRYRLPRNELFRTLSDLMEVECLAFEDFEVIARCLKLCDDAPIDFSDAVIAERHREQGCEATVTFDRRAATRLESMRLLA